MPDDQREPPSEFAEGITEVIEDRYSPNLEYVQQETGASKTTILLAMLVEEYSALRQAMNRRHEQLQPLLDRYEEFMDRAEEEMDQGEEWKRDEQV